MPISREELIRRSVGTVYHRLLCAYIFYESMFYEIIIVSIAFNLPFALLLLTTYRSSHQLSKWLAIAVSIDVMVLKCAFALLGEC